MGRNPGMTGVGEKTKGLAGDPKPTGKGKEKVTKQEKIIIEKTIIVIRELREFALLAEKHGFMPTAAILSAEVALRTIKDVEDILSS